MQYAPTVLDEDLELGVSIFVGGCSPSQRAKAREQAMPERKLAEHWEEVLHFLRERADYAPALEHYLEWLIYECDERRPLAHEMLVERYVGGVRALLKDYVEALSDGTLHKQLPNNLLTRVAALRYKFAQERTY